MKSQIFYSELRVEIEDKVKELLNSQEDYVAAASIESTRAVGDSIQDIVESNFEKLLGECCKEYSASFARRAMADLAFSDQDGIYYVVDVKTHRTDTKFNMPNLTSVERLTRFYEDDTNYFVLLLVSYGVELTKVVVSNVKFIPIEFLSWDCLTVGALGWGQIQIANSNNVTINDKFSRKTWMLELCDFLLQFYPKEISKIGKRIAHFEKVKEFWTQKQE